MMLRRKKKSREKRKEKKAATVQKLNPNWPYSNGSKLEEKKKDSINQMFTIVALVLFI